MELVFMVFLWRICALFCDARDIDKSKLGNLGKFEQRRESRKNVQNGHELSPGVTEKATANRSWGKSSFIMILKLTLKRFDTMVDFPGRKFWKTLLCKTVSKHVVNYAPSYGPPLTVLRHYRFLICHYEVAQKIGPKLVSQNSFTAQFDTTLT